MRKKIKKVLRWYQRDALQKLKLTESGGALWMEMRLGKTLVAIRYIKYLRRQVPSRQNFKVLIAAPLSAFQGWIDDMREDELDLVVVYGDKNQKIRKLRQPGNFYLINKEGILWGKQDPKSGKIKYKLLPEIEEEQWDLVILDESHFIKQPRSKITKFYLKAFKEVPFKVLLSGTPTEGVELDLVSQYQFILGEKTPYKDYWRFRQYFTRTYGFKETITPAGKQLLTKIGQSIAFSLKRKDAGLDKEKIISIYSVEMPPKAISIYKKLKEDFVLEFEKTRRLTKHIVAQYSTLRRICGGFLPPTEDGGGSVFLHEAKVKAVFQLLNNNFKNEPVLIWATFRDELDLLIDRFKKQTHYKYRVIHGGVKKEERFRIEKEFREGKFNVLLLQPETVKQGIDFSRASTSIYYSLPNTYITWSQSQDRILNVKKDDSLLIIIMEVIDTLEHDLYLTLDNKGSQDDQILSVIGGY